MKQKEKFQGLKISLINNYVGNQILEGNRIYSEQVSCIDSWTFCNLKEFELLFPQNAHYM